MANKILRAGWLVLVGAAVLTLILSPSGETPPARPEPGAERVIARVFEGDEQ